MPPGACMPLVARMVNVSDYDNDDEPEQHDPTEPMADEATITIPLVVSPQAIIRAAADRALSELNYRGGFNVDEQVRRQIDKLVQQRVRALVDEALMAMVSAAIERGLHEGFPMFDAYGDEKGRTATIEQQVRKALEAKHRKDYQSPELTLVERTMQQLLEGEIAKAMRDEIAKVAELARGKVRERFAGALADALAKG